VTQSSAHSQSALLRLGTRGTDPCDCTVFSADQLGRMAERERERWRPFMTDNGWTRGPERENRNKVTTGTVAEGSGSDRIRRATPDEERGEPR